MQEPATETALNTGELSKLPTAVQPLVDPATPLPADVRFFEVRETYGDFFKTMCIGVGLIAFGIALVFPGVLIALYAAIVGVVLIFCGLLLIGTLRTKIRSMQAQGAGRHTRFGAFVTPAAVLLCTELDYTYIPRSAYHDLQGATLYYHTGDKTKSLNLPQTLFGATPVSLQQAVREWAKGSETP
jgi:hypothetical protein